MWQAAVGHALDQYHVTLDDVEDPLIALIVSRVPIVTDQNLNRALQGTLALVDGMMTASRRNGFGRPAPVFLNLALQQVRPLFPYTN